MGTKTTVSNETNDNNVTKADEPINLTESKKEKTENQTKITEIQAKKEAAIEARNKRRRQLEMEMLRNRQNYQRNDIMSFFFLILVLTLLGFLCYRRYNNEMPSLTYTDSSSNGEQASRAGAASGEL